MTDQIISTKDQIGSYDAIETLKPGEPVFPLQGGDPLAPLCVMIWAWKARRLARTMDEAEQAKDIARLLRKASAAEEVAWAMRDYQKGTPDSAPLAVPEIKVGYGGATMAATGAWLPGIVAGVRHLSEAAAAFAEAAAHLPQDQASAMLAAIEDIKAIGARYQPRRASYTSEPEFPTA